MTEYDVNEGNAAFVAQLLDPLFELCKDYPLPSAIIYLAIATIAVAVLWHRAPDKESQWMGVCFAMTWPIWALLAIPWGIFFLLFSQKPLKQVTPSKK